MDELSRIADALKDSEFAKALIEAKTEGVEAAEAYVNSAILKAEKVKVLITHCTEVQLRQNLSTD